MTEKTMSGAIDAGRQAHHWSCPLNARNIGKSSDDGIPSLQGVLDITISDNVEGYIRTPTGNCSDVQFC